MLGLVRNCAGKRMLGRYSPVHE